MLAVMQAPNKIHTSATGATQVLRKRLSPPRPRLSILAAFSAAHELAKALEHEKGFLKERVQDLELGAEILTHLGGLLLAVELVQSHVSKFHILCAAINTWLQRRRRKCRGALDLSRSAAERYYQMAKSY